MKKIIKYFYNLLFWISKFFTVSIFVISLLTSIHAKYVLPEKYSFLNILFIEILDRINDFFLDLLFSLNTNGLILYKFNLHIFDIICKNSQNIDLLLMALISISAIGIIITKFFRRDYRYLLTISIISSVVYLIIYSIFKLPIMLALTISTPIIFIIIYFSNKLCPIQKIIMLIPIIGEVFCIKAILKYISKKTSDKILNISLLIIGLILSNTICFLFPYKTNKDFENRIMNNWTYSIRPYQDKLIISGDRELIVIDKNNNKNYIKDETFNYIEDFFINNDKEKLYFYSLYSNALLTFDIKTLNITNKIIIDHDNYNPTRICCSNDFLKYIVIYECSDIGCLIDLNTFKIKYFREVAKSGDGLIYNKYRNCFLVSFYLKIPFLQELDIENKKIRKIKTSKYQGYIAMSEKNKEIYIAFNQQGKIGVYDAQTMKLKRKIKSNYTVKNITYDEELNILIAPSYFTGYVDIFLMDGSDKLLTREFVGYELREGCFDPQKENLYVCSINGLYKKKIDIRNLIEQSSNVSHETKN